MNVQEHPLRVAVVASSLRLAGAEKQTYYQALALHKAGIDVRLFHPGAGGYYLTALRQAGVPVRQIFEPNRPWRTLVRLTDDLWRLRPHIILAAQFSDLQYAGAAGRLCGALTLGGIRSDGFYELNSHGWLSPWMIRMAHGLVSNSERSRQNLASKGIHPEKIEVLPNVINLRDFDDHAAMPLKLELPPGRIIATAVGSLHPCKRFDRFLRALARAKHRMPAITGVIAGADCGAKAELQAQAKALGLTSRDIMFAGEVDNVPALLVRSAMLILTSDYEGFPNVILEAMAARLPVISVPAGDAARIVKAGRTGHIVEPDDTERMSEHMVQLAQCAATRNSFGESARLRVEQEYNFKTLASRLTTVCRHFAGQHGKSSLWRQLANYPDGLPATNRAGTHTWPCQAEAVFQES